MSENTIEWLKTIGLSLAIWAVFFVAGTLPSLLVNIFIK